MYFLNKFSACYYSPQDQVFNFFKICINHHLTTYFFIHPLFTCFLLPRKTRRIYTWDFLIICTKCFNLEALKFLLER